MATSLNRVLTALKTRLWTQDSAFIRDNPDDLVPRDEVVQAAGIGANTTTEFVAFGEEICRNVLRNTKLQPDGTCLDVGCGLGALARPLTKYLSDEGRYEGFDIVRPSVEWCKQEYRNHTNFHFQIADIYNTCYNPEGKYKASEYKFPYPDETFDAVVLNSILTHLLPSDMENYFHQITRVMKTGGRCMITYFLLNPEALRGIAAGVSTPKFPFEHGSATCRVDDEECLEAATAHDEGIIRSLYDKYSLSIERIEYGDWCRRSLSPLDQDTITAVKV